MREVVSVRRILVAIDASPASLAALEAAAHVAAQLGAEISGLYVEDEALIRTAALPLARVVGSFSGNVRRIEPREVEHQLRAQARRARHALETVANRARVRWSFRVVRGAVAPSLGEASAHADLVSLGRRGWAPGRSGIGGTTAALLEAEGVPVLLLDRGLRPGQAVVVIYGGGSASGRALDFACALTRNGQVPLAVVLRGSEDGLDDLEGEATSRLAALGASGGVRFYRLGLGDPKRLLVLNHTGGIGILILPGAGALGKAIPDLLSELRCPVLVIRKVSEPVTRPEA